MEPSPKRLCLSLEPLPLYDDLADDLFARPPRLVDVNLESGTEVYSRDDPEKSISERLKRIWAERGDFSALTSESILAPVAETDELEAEKDTRPSAQDMRELQRQLMEQLTLARVELTTALDLLSVLAPPTDPPSVDLESLPLPPQTLVSIPTVPRPPPATDDAANSLPLATSLSSLRSSAQAFFTASDPLFLPDEGSAEPSSPKPTRRAKASSDSWPQLLHLRSTTAHTLLPLGALRGASLTGKGETRAARQVGIFYGCEEAKEGFRRGAVARVEDLGEEGMGRTMMVTVTMEGREERVVWEAEGSGMEGVLEARGRSAFGEELFAALTSESRADAALKARLVLGKRSVGDSVTMDGLGWSLTLTMIAPSSIKSPPTPTSPPRITRVLLPVLRLLFLQEYAERRSPSTPPWTRPILSTLSVFLSHTYRLQRLSSILGSIVTDLEAAEIPVQLERFGAGTTARVDERSDLAESVVRTLRGDTELGGRAVLRLSPARIFHISYSLLLPQPAVPSAAAAFVGHQSLVLQSPGAGPVGVPSLSHLQTFLREQVLSGKEKQ